MNKDISGKHLLTIVVPVHNRAEMAVCTLDSIADSSCKAFNLIIVDNASTDGTMEVCQQWALRHSFEEFEVTVVEETKSGAPAARNRGLSLCQTPYIYFFDSDDLFDSQFIAEMLYSIQDCTDQPDMVFVPVQQQQGKAIRTRSYKLHASPHEHILNAMLCTPSMLFRTAWLRQLGGWNEELTIWQDWELGLRVLLAKPNILWTQKPYHTILIHPNSITGKSYSLRLSSIVNTLEHALIAIDSSIADKSLKAKCKRTLLIRTKIIAGKMALEGNTEACHQLAQWAKTAIDNQPLRTHIIANLLQRYSSLGGRAAWRIGIAMC
ncbi:MAG: glycosyltransferase family 2 protein [Bacteroidaceae bacterium]|nr:glycosyltransferase family 2 protein [Bacteroidaceae bacterium]